MHNLPNFLPSMTLIESCNPKTRSGSSERKLVTPTIEATAYTPRERGDLCDKWPPDA